MNFNTVPNNIDYKYQQILNEESLKAIYPDNKQSENPLPIYIISAHGICYHGVSLKNNSHLYSLEPSNSVLPNSGYGHNIFSPPKDCYTLHTSVFGSAAISSKYDNYFLRSLIAGKRTRQNNMYEPNNVTFARQLFNRESKNCIETKPVEILFQRTVAIFNEVIEDLIYDIYKNVKRYNLRRKGMKMRINKKKIKKYYQFPELMFYDRVMEKNNEIKMKKYINRGKNLLKHTKLSLNSKEYCNYHRVFSKLESEVRNLNKKFKDVIKTQPVIGMPGIPTIEKHFDFTESISKEKQNWYMGIIEISKNTEQYLQKHTEIKFAERIDKILNNTKNAQKDRIINNIHDNVLSGNCIHKNKTKTQWLTERINHTIDYPNTNQKLTLSELMYQFGRGIYICMNCSPLYIWNSNKIYRFSKRLNPHYCLNPMIQNTDTKQYTIKTEDDYIMPKNMTLNVVCDVDKYLSTIVQNDIYTEIFNLLVQYNEKLYNYWPENIQVFPKSTRLARIYQPISPEYYEIY